MQPLSSEDLPVDPVRAALLGPHRRFALGGDGPAVRYRPEVSAFAALVPGAWNALAGLGDAPAALISAAPLTVPAGWTTLRELRVLRLSGEEVEAGGDDDPEVVPLTDADVPAMLDLTRRTQPGPFHHGTIALGGYVGVRRDGDLVAMAGRRFHPPGWIEVSAVCVDPRTRGAGLGRRVTAAVVGGIRAEGARPFLHVLDGNPARGLYEAMGFVVTGEQCVTVVQRAS